MGTLIFIIISSLCVSLAMPLHAEETERIVCGGWQIQSTLDADSLAVFQEGATFVKEYRLKPISCATQLVAGLNYCFLCVALPEKNGEWGSYAALNLYVNLQGKVALTGFRLISFASGLDHRQPGTLLQGKHADRSKIR